VSCRRDGRTRPRRPQVGGLYRPAAAGIDIKITDPQTWETRISDDQLSPQPDEEIDFENEDEATGEITLRGPSVFEGYHDLPEQTEAVFDDEG